MEPNLETCIPDMDQAICKREEVHISTTVYSKNKRKSACAMTDQCSNKDVLNIQQTCKYKIQEDEYPGAPWPIDLY